MVQIDTNILKILIVGLGSIGKRHLKIVKEILPNSIIIAYGHDERNKQDKILGIDKSFIDLKKVIDEKPDIAIISNPASLHVPVAKELALSGIDLLIEKPLSDNYFDARDLVKTCKLNNIKLMTGFNLRYLPCLVFLRQQLQKSIIGRVMSIRIEVGQNLKKWRPNTDYSKSVSANKNLGGGVLLELSHEIDYLSWLFGDVKWVFGHISHLSKLDLDVEDSANILIGLDRHAYNKNNVVASINMDFLRNDDTRYCYVIGEDGTLKCNLLKGSVEYFSKKINEWEEIFSNNPERNYTFKKQFLDLLSLVDGGIVPESYEQNGLKNLEIIDAIKLSSKLGERVFL